MARPLSSCGFGYPTRDGAFTDYTRPIHVLNAPPSVYLDPAGGTVGQIITVNGRFVDLGQDTFVATCSYGDGSPDAAVALNADKTFVITHTYASVGTYTLLVRLTDSDGFSGLARTTITVAPAPTDVAVRIDDGSAQRSVVRAVTYTFTSDIASIDAGAFTLLKVGGGSVDLVATRVDPRTYVLSFTGTGTEYGSLADGRYTLTLESTMVHAVSGGALAADSTVSFHRLFGDSNGDAVVGAVDVSVFIRAMNKSSADVGYVAYFDLDSSGLIDAWDYNQFRLRSGRRV